jgi:hypothetical protein
MTFRRLLDCRGLLMDDSKHDEKFVFKLEAGQLAIANDPSKVREAVMIAKAVYGEGRGEHKELSGLYACRDDLDSPVPRDIVWEVHTPDGPGLNPGRWIRLDVWLSDQFLLEYALKQHLEHGAD